jgi:hypothetical protein
LIDTKSGALDRWALVSFPIYALAFRVGHSNLFSFGSFLFDFAFLVVVQTLNLLINIMFYPNFLFSSTDFPIGTIDAK